jgi:ferrous iron transport protein A
LTNRQFRQKTKVTRSTTRRIRELTRTLRDTKKGETVKVVKLNGSGAIKRRIMDMGITKGCEIFIRKVAPLGDPVEFTIRGYELSLRKGDAEMVEVE